MYCRTLAKYHLADNKIVVTAEKQVEYCDMQALMVFGLKGKKLQYHNYNSFQSI